MTVEEARPRTRADNAIARLLRVEPRPADQSVLREDGWPFQTSLLVSAMRCTLRYLVLPVLLPLFGIVAGATLGILLLLDVIAAVSIVATLRRLWRIQHPTRWQYLAIALGLMAFVTFFLVGDAGGMDF